MELVIYCDGAYSSSRDQGGWSYVVLKNDEKIYSEFNGEKKTTNNRMEIQAAIKACEWVKKEGYTKVTIFTDSMYVIGTMTKNWKRNKNNDLWKQLDDAVSGLNIIWTHVKGHTGNKYNELCDILAVTASKAILSIENKDL